MSRLRVVRRALTVFVVAFLVALPFTLLEAVPASAATVRITNTSASPPYASRFASPKYVAVRYKLSKSAKVTVKIVSPSGATTRLLVNNASRSAGAKVAYWNLKTTSGGWAANGKYTIRISAKDRKGHAAYPNPAKVYAYVDNTAPTGAVYGIVSPAAINPSLGEACTITYRLSDNVAGTRLRATLEVLNSSG